MSSSAPYSQTPSAYVLPLMRETKFHTHIKEEKISSVYFNVYISYSKLWMLIDKNRTEQNTNSLFLQNTTFWIAVSVTLLTSVASKMYSFVAVTRILLRNKSHDTVIDFLSLHFTKHSAYRKCTKYTKVASCCRVYRVTVWYFSIKPQKQNQTQFCSVLKVCEVHLPWQVQYTHLCLKSEMKTFHRHAVHWSICDLTSVLTFLNQNHLQIFKCATEKLDLL